MVDQKQTSMYYLKKRGLFYRPFSRGYTENIVDAGMYTEEQVEVHRQERACETTIVPVAKLYQEMLIQEDELLNKARLLRLKIDWVRSEHAALSGGKDVSKEGSH